MLRDGGREEQPLMSRMVSPSKIVLHKERIESYLRGDPVFPVTLELCLTSLCDRRCPGCPSGLAVPSLSVDIALVERILGRLAGHTKGLIVTGGEPTLSPVLPTVLRLARREHGFEDIAVVTNGTGLDRPAVAEALVSDASAVRISLYDWQADSFDGLEPSLARIRNMRALIERSGSTLEIGTSALTSRENAGALDELAGRARGAGADWIYFHPSCTRDGTGGALRTDQEAVLGRIEECRGKQQDGFRVFSLDARYRAAEVRFEGYHAAHFILVVGADGKNYLSTEVKYQPEYAIADLGGRWDERFLWRPRRQEHISSVLSRGYPAKGSMNRGVLYSTLIEGLSCGTSSIEEEWDRAGGGRFRFPHII